MTIGYEGSLYILAFDHRGSFQKKFFGIEGAPGPEEALRIIDAKKVVFEGMQRALADGVDQSRPQACSSMSSSVPMSRCERRTLGISLSMPVEKSGQPEFDFEYGAEFTSHIESFDPHFSKVLVRYNPQGDGAMNAQQALA